MCYSHVIISDWGHSWRDPLQTETWGRNILNIQSTDLPDREESCTLARKRYVYVSRGLLSHGCRKTLNASASKHKLMMHLWASALSPLSLLLPQRWSRWPDKQVALMFQLCDALASAESLLALQSALVHVCVCDRKDFSSAVGLWFERCGSNTTARHRVRKDRTAAKKKNPTKPWWSV